MRKVKVTIICDEGFVADSLRDFATAYEDNFGDEHEFEHGNGRLEFVEVQEPEEKQEDVVAGIAAKRKSLDDAALEAEYRQLEHMRELEKKVKDLAPRLRKMFDVAEALTRNRFYLGPKARESPLWPDGTRGPHCTEKVFLCGGDCSACAETSRGCWGAKKGDTILFEAH